MNLRMLVVAAFAVALVSASCTTPIMVWPTGNAEYRAGFRDGCVSGYAATGSFLHKPTKDAEQYASDSGYKSGWGDGFGYCRDKHSNFDLTDRVPGTAKGDRNYGIGISP